VIRPFLAAIPVTTQITGVSDHSVLPRSASFVAEDPSKRYWISFQRARRRRAAEHRAEPSATTAAATKSSRSDPRELGLGTGSFDDLLPVDDLDDTVRHFALLGETARRRRSRASS
jgi:hypothetical protein